MRESNDATPAYRGYRLQALYALFRILDQEGFNNLVFQPEKWEDLSIQDEKGDLLEVIQVKSNSLLELSSFKKPFFQRIYPLIKRQKPPQIIIVSYGKIGRELRLAIERDGPERTSVSKKIKNKYAEFIHSDEEARIILENLKLESRDESELTEKVYSYLKNTLTGIDPYNAFDNLSYWLYVCSENKSLITKIDVINKIQNIGKFFSELAAHHEEWFKSINPIDDREINCNEIGKLREEFYQGISAKYVHILADTDVLRPNKIKEIETKFGKSSVVIIHGASGQGKTTLAYRYLREHFPNMWRFKIELVQDRKHALSIARAILGHADAIDMPVVVYLDVSAKDKDWPDLINQLSTHRNIKILVTIREEDYKRAIIQDSEVQFKDIDLTFDKSEAQEIYKSLEKTKIPPQFLNFEDAWNIFGGEGPLMEFIYLVTQGESLQKKLEGQVDRLGDYEIQGVIEHGAIKLLTLVSVASAYGAQLKVKPLIDSLKLVVPKRTFELFENEYLLRLSPDGSLVKGLHPIRSEILVDLLIDPTLSPWSEYATSSLPLMNEIDIENFLLYAFSRRRKDIESLLVALNTWHPPRWVMIGGITRALIWLGILEYVEMNKELIQDAFEDSRTGFTFLLDSDISDAIPGLANSTLNTLCSLNPNDEFRQRVLSYRARQTSKSYVFKRAKEWLSSRTACPAIPQCNEDWSGMAEVSFWVGYFGVPWSFSERIPCLELEKSIEYLPLEILADLILGLSHGYGKDFATWRMSNHSRIINRFREETLTVDLQYEENKVNAHFLIEFEKLTNPKFNDDSIEKPKNYLHDEAMRRIKLLRRILPERDIYACQGYGHRIWSNEILFDDTYKVIPKSSLPSRWLTSINSTFRGLAVQPYRPHNWHEYAKIIFELREQTLDAVKELENGLKIYFQKQKPDKLFGKLIDVDRWNSYQQLLSKWPLVPLCAVDEWGFVDELDESPFDDPSKGKSGVMRGLALQKHKPFLTCFVKYKQHLRNFLKQSVDVMLLNPIHGKSGGNELGKRKFEQKMIENRANPEFTRSETDLSELFKTLPIFQRKFRQNFGQFFEISNLDDLEKQELTTFHSLWCIWYFFSVNPNLTTRNPKKEFIKKIDRKTNNIKRMIEESLLCSSSENLHISVASYNLFWKDKTALWISLDGKNGIDVYNSVEKTIHEISRFINCLTDKKLVKRIFDVKWPLIIIVPKIQGKCLTAKAWKINSNTLLSGIDEGNLSWWNFESQHSIQRKALTNLNIEVWNISQLEIATKFAQSIVKLSFQLASIKDSERLSELDDQGINQIKTYAQKLMDDISISIQNIYESAEEMIKIFGDISPSDYYNHSNMIESVRALIEVGKYIIPVPNSQGETTLEAKTVLEWANKLDDWRNYAMIAYLFWASDVIDNENKEKALKSV